MKHLFKSIVCLMLVASAAAQAQDAFYVYQNDGHFDGFFYDEVEKIRYSKLDTLGFEHEVYVQEIVTADSTYRFMLTAIDSIGFVQPEIKYNPNVRRVREEGILDYVGYHDEENMRLYFYGTTPEDKLPHVGDVLLDFDLEEGFCGKVTEVDDGGLSIIVRYAPLESMREVFQRFVCVEQYDHNSQGELVRSRVAGMPQLTRGNWDKSMAKARDDFDFSLFDINFNGHLPVGFEENFSMAVDINAHVAMRLKGSYNISYLDPIYIGLLFTSDVSLGMGVTIDGELKKIIESSTDFIPGIPIPAAAPIFELRNIPGLFARGDIHLKFSANLVNIPLSQVWHKIEFNDDWLPSLSFGKSKKTLAEQKEEAGSASPSAYMEFNGYLQTGVHAPLTLSTNRWLSKICKAEFGTHLYIGPKLSGNLQVDFTEIMKQGVSFYNAHKNSALKLTPLSVDFETKATMSGWWGKEKKVTFGDGSITVIRDYGLYLFPEFDRWNEVKDPHDSKGNVLEGQFAGIFCKNRNTIFPYQIGIRVFRKYSDKEYEPIGDIWEDREYRTGSTWNYGEKWLESENMLDHPHFNLDYLGSAGGGEVRLRPIFRCGSFVLEGSPDYECWAGEYFRAEKDEVEIPCEIGEEICVGIDTNMKIGSVSDSTIFIPGMESIRHITTAIFSSRSIPSSNFR